MKKLLVLLAPFLLSSCYMQGCYPSAVKREEAQRMYNDFGTSIARNFTPEQGEKLFAACYEYGDYVYVYSGFWGKKYILVQRGEVVTYADEDDLNN